MKGLILYLTGQAYAFSSYDIPHLIPGELGAYQRRDGALQLWAILAGPGGQMLLGILDGCQLVATAH